MSSSSSSSMASRRVRAFKRWMKSCGIDFSDSLEFLDSPEEGILVRALCDLKEGDVIATIPKSACLTIQTTRASEMINAAGLSDSLGLCVALMYERSLGHDSQWAGYLQLLPPQESLPLVWTPEEVDTLLCGTELYQVISMPKKHEFRRAISLVSDLLFRQTVKEDKALICEDWKESILPLLDSESLKLNPKFFGVQEYFAAKSLIASRSFAIDQYHGSGMVPLADLFNHKTGAEDVHFSAASSALESESDSDTEDNGDDMKKSNQNPEHEEAPVNSTGGEYSSTDSYSESSLTSSANDPSLLEMIMVKDVKSGSEIFNTYGALGNAALLHRYGFTEPDNLYDIVNIDLELVLRWGSSTFSNRYSRSRLSFWRRLDYSGCISENSEYFEVSYDGKPQIELLILLFIILLPEETCQKLDLALSTAVDGRWMLFSTGKKNQEGMGGPFINENLLLTRSVCSALLQLADIRESFYCSSSMKEDIEAMDRCSLTEKKYHSLALCVSERRILEKLRQYAAVGKYQSLESNKRSSSARKRSKKL